VPESQSPVLRGVVPIIPTPFRADETIDYQALARCVRFAASCEFSAACLPAYGSEFYKLSDAERLQVVEAAIATSEGRIPIIAQSNHPSSYHAAELARRHEQMGASVISFALPRQFILREQDLLDYARRVCEATRLPVLVQDFHPGGSCVAGDFAAKLHDACSNFQFLKLEEPLVGAKTRDITRATGGEVAVLEGLGGIYMMELIADGIVGLMPGLGASDLLQRVWDLAYRGEHEASMDAFQTVLPQLAFSLQNLELWLFVEKKLLAVRGIIPESSAFIRQATRVPEPTFVRQALWLNERLLRTLDKFAIPRNPLV
jgi:dihydrodipicolinate synthase/N-acetylneuraminate lyase